MAEINKNYLPYEPANMRRQRRRLLFAFVFVIIIVTVPVAIYEGCRHSYVIAQYYFMRCLRLKAFSDSPIYQEGVDARMAMTTHPNIGKITHNSGFTSWISMSPAQLDRYYNAAFGQGVGNDDVILFCGRLTSPSGHERLVTVGWQNDGPFNNTFSSPIIVRVFKSGGLWERPTVVRVGGTPHHGNAQGVANRGALFEWFFGHQDSSDLSEFIIPYKVEGVPGTVTGHLHDDDTADYDITSGPGFDPGD